MYITYCSVAGGGTIKQNTLCIKNIDLITLLLVQNLEH
jgi:hypothetical protein